MQVFEDIGVFERIIVILLLVIIITLGINSYQKYTSNSIELSKTEWQCTALETKQVTAIVAVGKVMVPTVHTVEVCNKYERKYNTN